MIEKKVVVIPTNEIKLKRPNKDNLMLDLKQVFGFLPNKIIIKLAPSRNNTFIIGAVDERNETAISKVTLANEKKKARL